MKVRLRYTGEKIEKLKWMIEGKVNWRLKGILERMLEYMLE